MSASQLQHIKDQLKPGDRYKLAMALGVNPAKITWALDGLVKSKDFMDKLQREAIRLIGAQEQLA